MEINLDKKYEEEVSEVMWKRKDIPFSQGEVKYYARLFNVHPFIVESVLLRGISTEDEFSKFFYPSASDLINPFLFTDMEKAVSRVNKAISNQEKIVIFGDYDADGITSTALLKKALLFLGANVDFKIPLRSEGYGITPAAIEQIADRGDVSLIITVDNGSTAHEAMKVARKKGLDVIVTDHHEIIGRSHPDCFAFINPKREDCRYPFKHLCGAGVAFKFTHALFQSHSLPWEKLLWNYVELATLGTIADVMPLFGENRTISKLGLKKFNMKPSLVFQSLFELLYIRPGTVDSSSIGFKIAPVLNASGRVGDPNIAAHLLSDERLAPDELRFLVDKNEERKRITSEQFSLASQTIEKSELQKRNIIVVCEDFHEGIIGILAAKISERYKKPSIVINYSGKGSARTAPNSNFSIVGAIEKCSKHLKSFGGHQGAAGLSIELKNLEKFESDIQLHALSESFLPPELLYDAMIPLNQFPHRLLEELKLLEPFGSGNPLPLFFSPETFIHGTEVFGKQEKHLKMKVNSLEAVCFSRGEEAPFISVDSPIDILYTPSLSGNFIIHDFLTKCVV